MAQTKRNIVHHLSDELLYMYAGGCKEQALNLIISEHLHECGECSSRLFDIQEVMGDFFFESTRNNSKETDTSLEHDFDNLWNALTSESNNNKNLSNKKENSKVLSPLESYLMKSKKYLKKKNVFPGLKETILPISGDDLKVSIMDLSPNINIPTHTHKGTEITMVLSGGFYDENGSYNAGDIILKDKEHTHSPRVYEDENCRCLVVRYGNLCFTGSMGLIYNPIFSLLD